MGCRKSAIETTEIEDAVACLRAERAERRQKGQAAKGQFSGQSGQKNGRRNPIVAQGFGPLDCVRAPERAPNFEAECAR